VIDRCLRGNGVRFRHERGGHRLAGRDPRSVEFSRLIGGECCDACFHPSERGPHRVRRRASVGQQLRGAAKFRLAPRNSPFARFGGGERKAIGRQLAEQRRAVDGQHAHLESHVRGTPAGDLLDAIGQLALIQHVQRAVG